jgi:hypothetical protein
MISTHLAQVGGAPNLAGLGGPVIWFSLAFFGLILGVLGSISGSLGSDRRREALVLGIISVVLGLLTLYPTFVLLFRKEGFSSLPGGLLLLIILLPLSSVCGGLLALSLRYRTRPR